MSLTLADKQQLKGIAAWSLAIYLIATANQVINRNWPVAITMAIAGVWFCLVVAVIVKTVQFARDYKGPEYLGAGSGTIIVFGIGLCGAITWIAVDLLYLLR